ncbi:HEAT repeat domain-containing protein [Tengunoibacter tsumagoiensis]|uniref:HEAT repeat domain-containing protein n=1 Tax=Tengunoibacter tsumagoiensis TaxID=2014871 RepID=UPI0013874711|nr:HEAT repeat domain-containing protein [Tengunoibacter tsumagoiensis]
MYGNISLPLGAGLRFSLLQVFQPLRLRQGIADPNSSDVDSDIDTDEDEEQALEIIADSVIEALRQSTHNRLVILGAPGTGKTTVLKHLLYHQTQLALKDSTAPLPIFLSLPHLATLELDLPAYLSQIAYDLGLEAGYGQTLWQAIQQGQAVVCLDSLDEVFPGLRAGIIDLINELAQISGNIWIIGSRFTDYKGNQFQSGQFLEWELQPLGYEHRLQLAARLLPELQYQLTGSLDTYDKLDPLAYVQALSEHQQAATWGANPLLFSLGAVVYLRRGNLSGSRAMIYREVIGALLQTRATNRDLLPILAQVALALYQVRGRTFSSDDLRLAIHHVSMVWQIPWEKSEVYTQIRNSGVLDTITNQVYSFRHQTFQEYLVASGIASRLMHQDRAIQIAARHFLWSKHTYSRWNEIERLVVGILVQEYGEQGKHQAIIWIKQLLEQRSDPGNLSLELAIKILGEVAELEEWQSPETQKLEEMAATIWSQIVLGMETVEFDLYSRSNSQRSDRYLRMAADIGRLNISAQLKVLEPFVEALVKGGHRHFIRVLGAIHSHYTTQYLLQTLKNNPQGNYQRSIRAVFMYLGEFAPIEFLLDDLRSEDYSWINLARQSLKALTPYVPTKKLIPILYLNTFSRSAIAADILQTIAVTRELPLQELLTALHEGEWKTSFYAAKILASIQHPAAIDFLFAQLNDPLTNHRAMAVTALGEYKSPAILERLFTLLDDKEVNVRKNVLQVLKAQGRNAPLLPLLHLLNDPDYMIRQETLTLLEQLGKSVPLAPIIQAANDSKTCVRAAAIKVMGTLGEIAPLDLIIQFTNDPEPEIVTSSLLALGKLGHRAPIDVLIRFLKNPNYISSALEALSQKSVAERVPLQTLFAVYEQNWRNQSEIREAFSRKKNPLAHALLLKKLCEPYHFSNPLTATWLLTYKQAGLTIEERIKIVEDVCDPPYCRAIRILGQWGSQDALSIILKAVTDERLAVSEAATEELCKRADELSQTDLLDLLTHRYAWVRIHALRILTKCSVLPPLAPLVEALHDQDYEVRATAAKLLGRYPDEAPIEEILNATLDESLMVCREAAITLGKVGARNPALAVAGVLRLLERQNAITLSVDFDEEELFENILINVSKFTPAETLLQIMYTSASDHPFAVAKVLGSMGERTPIEQLSQALLEHPNFAIQRAAAYALSQTGKLAPVPILINALSQKKNQEIRRIVIAALVNASKYGNVPDDVFLQQILVRRNYDTYLPLFEAFNAQEKLVPVEIVAEALEHLSCKNISYVIQHLNLFPDLLIRLPEKLVVESLALYAFQHLNKESASIPNILHHISLDQLFIALTHPMRNIQLGILILLAYYPAAISLDPILITLHDPDSTVRRQAIECLQSRPEQLPIQPLIECLQDSNEYVCQEAISALSSLGAQAPMSEFMRLLSASNDNIRFTAIQALAQPGLIEQVPAEIFRNALEDMYQFHSPQIILEAFFKKDPLRATEYAISVVGCNREDLALAAFQLLRQHQPEIIPEILQEAVSLFAGSRPGRFFQQLSTYFIVCVTKYVSREQVEPGWINRLGELLDGPDWEVRAQAAQNFGSLQRTIPDTIIRQLLRLRHDPHSRAVRTSADKALAAILSLENGLEDD